MPLDPCTTRGRAAGGPSTELRLGLRAVRLQPVRMGRVVQAEEEELGGAGRRVVRVGDVVRLASHDGSMYLADLLRHLERVGLDGAPRWLGQTDDGQDLLTYIEGSVPGEPPYNLGDEQLVAAADLVRRFHDAVAGTPLCGDMETVCHGDLGPHNTVFRMAWPVAIIDWDPDVGPGQRAVDMPMQSGGSPT